jgi:hypothetical protein
MEHPFPYCLDARLDASCRVSDGLEPMQQVAALELTPSRPKWISQPPALRHRAGVGAACRPTPTVSLHSPTAGCGPSESPPAGSLSQLWASLARMARAELTYPLRLLGASSKLLQVLDSELAGSRVAAGALAPGLLGGHPGRPASGTPPSPPFLSIAPRRPPPPPGVGAACRPTPPGGPTDLARQVASHHDVPPSHHPPGPGQARPAMGLLGPSSTGRPCLPLPFASRGACGKLRCKSRSPRD